MVAKYAAGALKNIMTRVGASAESHDAIPISNAAMAVVDERERQAKIIGFSKRHASGIITKHVRRIPPEVRLRWVLATTNPAMRRAPRHVSEAEHAAFEAEHARLAAEEEARRAQKAAARIAAMRKAQAEAEAAAAQKAAASATVAADAFSLGSTAMGAPALVEQGAEAAARAETPRGTMRRAFDAYDSSGDGQISADEMRRLMLENGHAVTLEEVQEIIRGVDDDGDGQIGYDEFAKIMSSRVVKLHFNFSVSEGGSCALEIAPRRARRRAPTPRRARPSSSRATRRSAPPPPLRAPPRRARRRSSPRSPSRHWLWRSRRDPGS
jgi:hypothetical protein